MVIASTGDCAALLYYYAIPLVQQPALGGAEKCHRFGEQASRAVRRRG